MFEIPLSADELVLKLLEISRHEQVCLLDSCGVSHLNSRFLIAGIKPLAVSYISNSDPDSSLRLFEEKITNSKFASIFTISYDFGLKLEKIKSRHAAQNLSEPDMFIASFDCLLVHDYNTGKSFFTGNGSRIAEFDRLFAATSFCSINKIVENSEINSNFTCEEYLLATAAIKEHIRAGDTYQANLTQQFSVVMPQDLTAQNVFWKLRKSHPAPFSAFIRRAEDAVVSISPERFLKIDDEFRSITVSPIKGTRPRGITAEDDLRLKNELINSNKDRAENVMIVDLLRNDIGRICRYGTVEVEKLCELESHPTLYHLVSTIRGELRNDVTTGEILKAVFPCGSITGAPKIRTMQIIDQIETAGRGLSMGAIGCFIPKSGFDIPGTFDLNVAIRTMVIRKNEAVFNVGGGIVIDSQPIREYEESLIKAKALFAALNVKFER